MARHFWYRGFACLCEVPLGNGRRADLVGIGARGEVALVEVKVSAADLRGDRKWTDYLDYCDEYWWAVPEGPLAGIVADAAYLPDRSGLLIADGYEAAVIRPAPVVPLNAARRRAELLRFARCAAHRAMRGADAGFDGYGEL